MEDVAKEKNPFISIITPTYNRSDELVYLFKSLIKQSVSHQSFELIITKDMHERKKLLFDLGDAFMALPGGTGTIEEIVEIISWKVLGLHMKPIIFFNINNFWDPILKQFKIINEYKFGEINLQNIYQTIDTTQELNHILKLWKK